MKISYNIVKKHLPYIDNAEEIAQKLIMHTAEVEEIHSQKKDFENMVFGKITEIQKHPDADSLKICIVDVGEKENIQIVCGGSNLELGQGVAIAKIGASVLWHGEGDPVVMKKTSIRGVDSYGMICASEEIGLKEDFPAKDGKEILDLSFLNTKPGTPLSEALKKDDEILEIDNKAINHRPDMFSYMGVLRELSVIYNKELSINYKNTDLSKYQKLEAKNLIPQVVKRYSLLKIMGVSNIKSNNEIEAIIKAAGHSVKGLLIDLSNYSLYFYGQPAHIFDADKIEGNIVIRFACDDEEFIGLDDKIYKLSKKDIVIADDKKILALGGIIGGKLSAVSDKTKNILIETAHFDQAILRMSGKRLGIRTDSLNVFEKDIIPDICSYATSLILDELEKNFKDLKVVGYFDDYQNKQETIIQKLDIDFYNKLLGTDFDKDYVLNILKNLGIKLEDDTLIIPFWRKELSRKADIAEELARIHGYDKIKATIPRENIGAVIQDNIYKLKNDSRVFFTNRGFFDMYNYSFVNKDLYSKLNLNTNNLVPLKNYLSEDATHLKNSLIPNMMLGVEENIREQKNIKMIEIEKVFFKEGTNIEEKYFLSGIMTSDKDIVYFDLQKIVSDFLKTIYLDNFYFDNTDKKIPFAHNGRTANIIARGKKIGTIGEIHPNIAKKFDCKERIGFFEIDAEILANSAYNIKKAKELSNFQENNFDLCFLVNKNIKGKDIEIAIKNTNKSLITKVELFDIYEDKEKLPGKRSISFKIYIQSMTQTTSDEVKGQLIKDIISKVEKKGGVLR